MTPSLSRYDDSQRRPRVAALVMVRNEESSLPTTLASLCGRIDALWVVDTGSTDRTLDIVREWAPRMDAQQSSTLPPPPTHDQDHPRVPTRITEIPFHDFATTRNQCLDWAATLDPTVDWILWVDAGDELQPHTDAETTDDGDGGGGDGDDWRDPLRRVADAHASGRNTAAAAADALLVERVWCQPPHGHVERHRDVRLVRNGVDAPRYDPAYPVHESLVLQGEPPMVTSLVLFQDRCRFGGSSDARYHRDIDILRRAPLNRRNLYHLGQSYMSVGDLHQGYTWNRRALECQKGPHVSEPMTHVRAGYCAWRSGTLPPDEYRAYWTRAHRLDPTFLDPLVYLVQDAVDRHCYDEAWPYVEPMRRLDKRRSAAPVNVWFYDYVRWHLTSVVCLALRRSRRVGDVACSVALRAGGDKDVDRRNRAEYDAWLLDGGTSSPPP